MLFIGSDSVGDPGVGPFSTSAGVATVAIGTAAIPAAKNPGVYSAKKPTENTRKAPKENSITGTANGSGARASEAA